MVEVDHTAFERGAIDTVVERTSRTCGVGPVHASPPAPAPRVTLLPIFIPVLLSLSLPRIDARRIEGVFERECNGLPSVLAARCRRTGAGIGAHVPGRPSLMGQADRGVRTHSQ